MLTQGLLAVFSACCCLAFDVGTGFQSQDKNDGSDLFTLIANLSDADDNVRLDAIMEIGLLGSRGAPAVPALIPLLDCDDVRVRRNALTTLSLIGQESRTAFPKVITLFAKSEDSHTGRACLLFFRSLKNEAKGAVPGLLDALKNERNSPGFRSDVLLTLVDIDPTNPITLKCTASYLEDPSELVRVHAAWASLLVRQGAIDAKVITVLKAACNEKNYQVKKTAIFAIRKMVGRPDQFRKEIIMLANDPDKEIRQQIVQMLQAFATDDPDAFAALLRGSSDPDWVVRSETCVVLGRLPKIKDKTIGILVGALKDDNAFVKVNAAFSLSTLEPKRSIDTIALVVATMRDEKDPETKAFCAEVLGEFGETAVCAIPALQVLLDDEWEMVRKSAEQAIKKINRPRPVEKT